MGPVHAVDVLPSAGLAPALGGRSVVRHDGAVRGDHGRVGVDGRVHQGGGVGLAGVGSGGTAVRSRGHRRVALVRGVAAARAHEGREGGEQTDLLHREASWVGRWDCPGTNAL